MKNLVIASVAALAAALPATAWAARDSGAAVSAAAQASMGHMGGGRHWGARRGGRWIGGWNAPGGWNAYRRPVRGFVLPRYWIAPSFRISNYSQYGFARPHNGMAWSRYYDDAVLIDGRGHVYDQVHDVQWDRYDRYDDEDRYGEEYPEDYRDGYEGEYSRYEGEYRDVDRYERRDDLERRDSGVGGAIIGGVVGGVAGNRIAGRGNRTEGTLIGAGVGALAGAAIDRAEDRGRRDQVPYPYGADYDDREIDDRVTHGGYYHRRPHRAPRLQYAPVMGQAVYAHPGTVTTVIIQPAAATYTTTTTTTEFVEEVAHAPRYHAKPKRRWKAKPKCVCK